MNRGIYIIANDKVTDHAIALSRRWTRMDAVEEGRRQEAEGRRNKSEGDSDPS